MAKQNWLWRLFGRKAAVVPPSVSTKADLHSSIEKLDEALKGLGLEGLPRGPDGRVDESRIVPLGVESQKPAGPKDEKLKCDVCSSIMWRKSGYALTTAQVTTNIHYWQFLFKSVGEIQRHISLVTMPGQQAAHTSPWLVCESCSGMFDFDRSIAKDCAVRNAAPPNSGPADEDAVRHAAVKAMMSR
jgi:hypothetical protein